MLSSSYDIPTIHKLDTLIKNAKIFNLHQWLKASTDNVYAVCAPSAAAALSSQFPLTNSPTVRPSKCTSYLQLHPLPNLHSCHCSCSYSLSASIARFTLCCKCPLLPHLSVFVCCLSNFQPLWRFGSLWRSTRCIPSPLHYGKYV